MAKKQQQNKRHNAANNFVKLMVAIGFILVLVVIATKVTAVFA